MIHQIRFHHASTNENREVETVAGYNHGTPTYISTFVEENEHMCRKESRCNSELCSCVLASLLGNFTQLKKFRFALLVLHLHKSINVNNWALQRHYNNIKPHTNLVSRNIVTSQIIIIIVLRPHILTPFHDALPARFQSVFSPGVAAEFR